MRDVTVYIAMSLDGYIADRKGGVDWLTGQEPERDTTNSYDLFVKDIDTVLMGWRTYHQIVTELSPATWPYGGMTCYVLTHRPMADREDIRFRSGDAGALVRRLREEPGGGIWICGGADLIRQLIRENLIDRLHLSIIPTVLGGGIPLFEPSEQACLLRLIRSGCENGIAELVYERRDRRKE